MIDTVDDMDDWYKNDADEEELDVEDWIEDEPEDEDEEDDESY